MDRIAASGVRFTAARSHIPITGPSHATLFTSRSPLDHGVRNNAQAVPAAERMLAELLSEAGYTTAGFVSLGVLRSKFGFGKGFDVYVDNEDGVFWKRASELTDDILRWLGDRPPGPLFLWAHYSDPHAPYAPPGLEYSEVDARVDGRIVHRITADGAPVLVDVPLTAGSGTLGLTAPDEDNGRMVVRDLHTLGRSCQIEITGMERLSGRLETRYRGSLPILLDLLCEEGASDDVTVRLRVEERLTEAEARRRYALEVEYADREIGRLLDGLRRAGVRGQDRLLVLVSDHGEGVGDHGLRGHVHQLYDSLLHVPLLMAAPGLLDPGVVRTDPVGLIDVAPTVLDLLGVERPEGMRGRCLFPPPDPAPHLASTHRPQAKRNLLALIDGGRKLILAPDSGQTELYDVARDPAELEDVGSRHPDVARELTRRLRRVSDATEAGSAAPRPELDDDDRAALRALGYVDTAEDDGVQ